MRALHGIGARHAAQLARIGNEFDARRARKQALIFRHETNRLPNIQPAGIDVHAEHLPAAAINTDKAQ